MIENKSREWNEYLEKAIQSTTEKAQELLIEDRKDESNHIKIKVNIYEVFKTIFSVLEKNIAKEKNMAAETIKASYLNKMETIPASWKQSLENAKAHNDVEKILIEEIKLDTVKEIRQKFVEIWGVE